jgi:RNA binding exosome subunit
VIKLNLSEANKYFGNQVGVIAYTIEEQQQLIKDLIE